MERLDLCEKMESLIASCEARYAAAKNDNYRSTVYASERETLQRLLKRVKGGETGEQMLERLKGEMPELEEEMDREAEYPTFDWYGEHYVYIVMEGHRDAYLEVIEMLEENIQKG